MSFKSRIPYARLSGFYLLYFAVLGAFIPYWSLYLGARGHTPAEIGLVLSIPALTKILVPVVWGRFADRHNRLLTVIRSASLLSLAGFMLMLWPWDISGLVVVMFCYTFFQNGIMPLFDTLTLEHLDTDSHHYARIRIWGSIGFILAVMGIGELLQWRFSVEVLPYLIALLLGGVWVMSLSLPDGVNRHAREAGQPLAHILKRVDVLAFFFACLLLQFSHGPYYVFFSVYLDSHGYTKREIGGLWSLGVLAEIILFLFVPVILRHFTLRVVFISSLMLGGLRWWLLGWAVESPLLMVLIQCLHAASFGAAHIAAVHLVQHYFKGLHHGTGQTLYGSASFGLGGMLGSLVAGYLWVPLGPHGVYALAGAVSFAGALVAGWGMRKTAFG